MPSSYSLNNSVDNVKGIGPKLVEKLAKQNISQIKDLLLWLPLRYEDKRITYKISALPDLDPSLNFVTVEATVRSVNNHYRGRKSIQRANIEDETGKTTVLWFNNRYILNKLAVGKKYRFSGKLGKNNTLVQPSVEAEGSDRLHTGRLVPVYSSSLGIKIGSIRRIFKEILDNLKAVEDWPQVFTNLHFPDEEDEVVKARQKLALEELLSLIDKSKHIKEAWSELKPTQRLKIKKELTKNAQKELPFELTSAQQRSLAEILGDLAKDEPMNRLLIGDVGSGKTIVAALAGLQVIGNGVHVALIAPTQLLAEQHQQTISKLLPDLKTELVTANTKKTWKIEDEATFFIGTHALINKLDLIDPGLVIYDEQHRFGVKQRTHHDQIRVPHTLTMSATPIPRSYMLTIFSHLSLSVIDELPAGRKPKKTWLVPKMKRADSLDWLAKTVSKEKGTALVVCPFINPSNIKNFENVAAVTDVFQELKDYYHKTNFKLRLELLHSKLTNKDKEKISHKLYENEIDILVTTPIVEVGLDVPSANVIIIEGAERFGLASLHQLRGRVGRAGQEAYCLLFTSSAKSQNNKRLKHFTQEQNGLKLAEFDLKNRGAGDIFGTQQHGFEDLRFADWANFELIAKARKKYDELSKKENWSSLIFPNQDFSVANPAAN